MALAGFITAITGRYTGQCGFLNMCSLLFSFSGFAAPGRFQPVFSSLRKNESCGGEERCSSKEGAPYRPSVTATTLPNDTFSTSIHCRLLSLFGSVSVQRVCAHKWNALPLVKNALKDGENAFCGHEFRLYDW